MNRAILALNKVVPWNIFQVVAEKQELLKERENLRCEMEDLRRTSGDTEREKETVKGQMNIVTIEKILYLSEKTVSS